MYVIRASKKTYRTKNRISRKMLANRIACTEPTGEFVKVIGYVERLIVEHGVLVVDERHVDGSISGRGVPLQNDVVQQQVVVAEHHRTSDALQRRFQRFDFCP